MGAVGASPSVSVKLQSKLQPESTTERKLKYLWLAICGLLASSVSLVGSHHQLRHCVQDDDLNGHILCQVKPGYYQ